MHFYASITNQMKPNLGQLKVFRCNSWSSIHILPRRSFSTSRWEKIQKTTFCLHQRDEIRNIAVIAHVDHGKTTLVDAMLKQSGTLENARNRIMDNKDQEKERGITILAKHTALVFPNGKRINLVDTPGHTDFGGEVERVLQMVEGFLLLVDVNEGVRPGTRYVLRKALSLKLKPLIMLNKVDRLITDFSNDKTGINVSTDLEDKLVKKVVDEIQDLFLDVATDADQLDFTILYGSGRIGLASTNYPIKIENNASPSLEPLFESIQRVIPPPKENDVAPISHLQMLVGNVEDINDDISRIAIGRIFQGNVRVNQIITIVLGNSSKQDTDLSAHECVQKKSWAKVTKIELIRGVSNFAVDSAQFGDVARVHLTPVQSKMVPEGEINTPLRECLIVGSTLCHPQSPKPWPYVMPDQPSYSLIIKENNSTWKHLEITDKNKSRFGAIKDRLQREALNNTSLRLEDASDRGKGLRILGRGLLHLGVILEDLRREGFEFELLAPETVTKKDADGNLLEPFEKVTIECKTNALSEIAPILSHRHAELGDCESIDGSGDRVIQHCRMAARTIGDLSLQIMKITKGDAVYRQEFAGFHPYVTGINTQRMNGAIVSVDSGYTTDYALSVNREKGSFFVRSGEYVYFGQVVGELNPKPGSIKQAQDMPLNVTKIKECTNMRANASDAAKRTQSGFSSDNKNMEELLSWAAPDEYVTVTPKSVRLRKQYFDGKTTKPKGK